MSKIEYTVDYDEFESSTVEDLLYNANTSSAFVAPRGTYYRYDNVPVTAVEALADADSVGAAYTDFKREFGPGELLGLNPTFEKVAVKPVAVAATPQNWTVSDNAVIDGVQTATETRQRFALTSVANDSTYEVTSLPTRKHTVNYRLHDNDIERQYTLDAVGVDAAVSELVKVLAALGITPITTTVVTYL